MAERFEDAWRRRFERAAEKYDRDHAVSGWSAEGLRRRLVTFAECFEAAALPPGQVVLDLGCGAGTYSAWLAALGHRVVALDYSSGTLRFAAERLGCWRTATLAVPLSEDNPLPRPRRQHRYANPHEGRAGVSLLAGEAYRLPLATGVLDVVVCVGVFQTLDRPRACLAEIRRVLVPGGRVFLMTLNARDVASRLVRAVRRRRAAYEDLRRYDPEVVRRWLNRARLSVERVWPVYVMPDGAARFSRVAERCGLYRAAERLGTAPMALAHAALFTARAE